MLLTLPLFILLNHTTISNNSHFTKNNVKFQISKTFEKPFQSKPKNLKVYLSGIYKK